MNRSNRFRRFFKNFYNKSGYTLLFCFLSYFLIFGVLFFGFVVIMSSLLTEEALSAQAESALSQACVSLLILGCVGLLLVFFATGITFLPLFRLTKKVVAAPDRSQNYFTQLYRAFTDSAQKNQALQEQLDDYRAPYPYELLNDLSAALRENNCIRAAAQIEILLQLLDAAADTAREHSAALIRSILFDMLSTIANAMHDMNIRFHTYSDLYFETLYACRNLPYTDNRELLQNNIRRLLSFYEQQLETKITTSYQLTQLMEECYTQPDFSIALLADKFHVSIAYMSYLIKKETGEHFSDYLWTLRMNKAKELLLTTDRSVDEISQAVGYLNTSSFRRKFKQETGMTPSQFRNETPTP